MPGIGDPGPRQCSCHAVKPFAPFAYLEKRSASSPSTVFGAIGQFRVDRKYALTPGKHTLCPTPLQRLHDDTTGLVRVAVHLQLFGLACFLQE
jgi:hypothetical protein